MSLYRIAKAGYKLIFPKAIRNAIYNSMPTFLKVVRAKGIQFLERSALHDEIYDEEYYVSIVDYYMIRSCDVIAESIAEVFSPSSAVDVGCGTTAFPAIYRVGAKCSFHQGGTFTPPFTLSGIT